MLEVRTLSHLTMMMSLQNGGRRGKGLAMYVCRASSGRACS